MGSGSITSRQIDGETMETGTDFIFLGSKITADGDWSQEIKTLAPWKKSCGKPRQYIKKKIHYFEDKGLYSQSYGFSSSHVWMWDLDYKKKLNAEELMLLSCVMLEKTLERPLDFKEIQQAHPKGN